MALRFAESGGQYHASTVAGPGVWGSASGSIVSSLPARNSNTWGYGQNAALQTPNLTGSGFAAMIAGVAYTLGTGYSAGSILIQFLDSGGSSQCELRINGSGNLYFTRNGTNLGAGNPTLSSSTVSLSNTHYIEFKAVFATGATGSCEVLVDGVTFLTLTSIQNATTTALGYSAKFNTPNFSGYGMRDFYVLDTGSGAYTTYLNDITVAEIYDTGAGVNADWTVTQSAFTLTSVANASGGTTVYTGTITNGATPTNAWQGFYFSISGFATGANNGGPWLCTASTATTITLQNASGVSETHAGACAFQNPTQAGIHGGIVDGYATTNLGTRPPADNQYIASSTTSQKTDYAHQALSLTGTIAGVVHRSQARKDDAGTRQIQQICLSAGTEEDSATISLTTTYAYYSDVIEQDPHTSAAWTLSGFNAATFGVKEIT